MGRFEIMGTPSNVHRGNTYPRELRECFLPQCKNVIPKLPTTSWKVYATRQYCSPECGHAAKRGGGTVLPDSKNLAEYISKKTRGGQFLADYHLGILNAFKKNKEVYKKLPLTPKVIQDSIDWLGKMGFGGIASREAPTDAKIDNRTEEEKLQELQLLLGSMNDKGLRRSTLVDKGDNTGQEDEFNFGV